MQQTPPKRRGRPPGSKKQKISSPTISEPSSALQDAPSLSTYTPPPAPASVPSGQTMDSTPSLPPSEMEEKPLSGPSKPRSKKPELPAAPKNLPSQRPPAGGPLGGKALECFVWSGAHDDDEEFLRRYAGQPQRIAFVLALHSENPEAAAACERLKSLT